MPAPAPDTFRRRKTWWLLLAAAAAATLVTAPSASRLSVRTDLTEVLAQDGSATSAYLDYLRDFGGTRRLFIVVASDPHDKAIDTIAVAETLSARLQATGLVDEVHTGLSTRDQEFLLEEIVPRWILNRTPDEDLVGQHFTPQAVDHRLAWMRAQIDLPFAPNWQSKLFASDPFGLLSDVDPATALPRAVPIDLATGDFASADGNAALVVASTGSHEIDAVGGAALQGALDRLFAQARSEAGGNLELAAVGGPLYAAHEERSVRTDLIKTVLTSAMAVVLVLVLYFGRSFAPLILATSVAGGLVWATAIPVTAYGGLSVLGVSFGSILLGLGIDYGIHGAVAFQRQVAQGHEPADGMLAAARYVLPAIAASVVTTATGFLVLTQASFTPLRELGVIVGAGIALMAVAFALIGAPLLVLQPLHTRDRGLASGGPGLPPVAKLVAAITGLAGRRPRTIVGVVAVATGLALLGWPRLTVSPDLSSLRSEDRPLQEAEAQLAEHFGIDMNTLAVTVTAPDLDEALRRAAEATTLLRARLPEATVVSPADWLLDHRTLGERARAWQRHRALLRSAVDRVDQVGGELGFAPDAFSPGLAVIDELASGRVPAPIPESTWPKWIAELIHRDRDTTRIAIHVRTNESTLELADVRNLAQAISDQAQGASVASLDLVGAEIQEAVFLDLERLGLWCVLAVAVVVLVSFRGSISATVLSLLPVTLAGIWMLGFASLLGVRMTPFAVMVLPVVIGIGVDDGLHVVHGRKKSGSLTEAAVATGGAMTLTTVTTCLAFGSLTLSSIPALRQGGSLVATGTAACLLLTLTLLPAIEALRRGNR